MNPRPIVLPDEPEELEDMFLAEGVLGVDIMLTQDLFLRSKFFNVIKTLKIGDEEFKIPGSGLFVAHDYSSVFASYRKMFMYEFDYNYIEYALHLVYRYHTVVYHPLKNWMDKLQAKEFFNWTVEDIDLLKIAYPSLNLPAPSFNGIKRISAESKEFMKPLQPFTRALKTQQCLIKYICIALKKDLGVDIVLRYSKQDKSIIPNLSNKPKSFRYHTLGLFLGRYFVELYRDHDLVEMLKKFDVIPMDL